MVNINLWFRAVVYDRLFVQTDIHSGHSSHLTYQKKQMLHEQKIPPIAN